MGTRPFSIARPGAMLNNHTVLLLAGMDAQFEKYDGQLVNIPKTIHRLSLLGQVESVVRQH